MSPVPAGRWPFPTLSLQSLRRRLDPYPAAPSWCVYPLLPSWRRPHPTGNGFGTRECPCTTTSAESRISGLQSFDYLQAPTLARPPGCSHRGACRARRPGRLHHASPRWLPIKDMASLRVRYGQLTRLDLHQLDCSLVGCSFPHPAPQEHGFAARRKTVALHRTPSGPEIASFAIRCSCVETLAGLELPFICPSNGSMSWCPLPSTGSLGSVPPLQRYYEALRLLTARLAALRCLRLAIPPCSNLFAPSRGWSAADGPGFWSAVPRPPVLDGDGKPSRVPGEPHVSMPWAWTPTRPSRRRSLRRDGVAFDQTHGLGSRTYYPFRGSVPRPTHSL